jgi:LysR family transcriptional regulator, carnitine catabolism transcriptional activator
VNLLDTQIGLVEAEECMAIIPSFGLPACRSRKVAMSELVDPTVNTLRQPNAYPFDRR